MRAFVTLALALALLARAAPARAQDDDERGRHHHRERTAAQMAHDDSTHTLAGKWQLWGHFGAVSILAPVDVRKRYAGGGDVGLDGDRRFADRFAVRGRVAYHDIPSGQSTILFTTGSTLPSSIGGGSLIVAEGGLALRPWRHLWLEGVAGTAYFRSGFPSSQTMTDPTSGAEVPLNANSGSGRVWSAGAHYEFMLRARQRYFGEMRLTVMDRAGTTLQFLQVLVGARFL